MGNNYCTGIGRSNVQQVFAVLEDVSGELQKPTATGFILPAGQSTMTQTPSYSPSNELSKSLNVLNQVQDAVTAGDISIPMYLRLGTDYSAPQGDDILTALMGEKQTPDTVTASTVGSLTSSDVSFDIDTVAGGFMPARGVVQIESEKIRYTTKTAASTTGQYTLGGCTRGYGGTTAATHTDASTVTLKSRVYMQSTCRPSVSVWVEFDHAVMFMSGCSVTQGTIPLSNSGGQMITVSLQGRRMGWVGSGNVVSAASGIITLGEEEANSFSVGGFIRNATKNDDNSSAGYKVTAVDADNNTITVSPSPTGWVKDDVLKPWLPSASGIGIAVESRDARVFINGATGRRREGDVTINTPTTFANEIGDEFPGDNADGKRGITISGGMYFRAEDCKQFGLGYKGYELPMTVALGDKAGHTLALHFPRIKFNTPTVGTDGEFYTLTQDGTALGVTDEREGESSLYLIQE